MAVKARQIFSRARDLTVHPRTRKIAIWTVSLVVVFGVLLGLVTPPLLRGKIAADLSRKLHREVTIEQIRLNPYINVVRNEDFKYNFQDIIDEFTSGPSGGPTPKFALNNIQLIDGRIEFDDQPEQTKHLISSINIGVPFISSLPSYTDIFVKPSFSADINGAPLHIGGVSKPFHSSHESTVDLDIDKLQIGRYLEYSPLPLNFKVPSGELNGKLNASFKTAKDSASIFNITGNLMLTGLAVEKSDSTPLGKIANF